MMLESLGWQVISWMQTFLSAPDRADDVPYVPTVEQEDFIVAFYALAGDGRRSIRRGVLSRPKGWGKSPVLASIAAAEGLAPVLFDHWAAQGEVSYWGYEYAEGEPVGRPWREIRTPLVQLSAVSEDQTRNAWTPLLEMLDNPRAKESFPGLEPMQTFVNLPGGGRIEFVTASARSREGNRPVFCVLDQTETWLPGNGGVKLAATMRRNLGKTGGSSIESPNAYLPGEGSVAEDSAAYWTQIQEGKARDEGLLYDHQEAPADTDLNDEASLLVGLRAAYGCSSKMPCVLPDHEHPTMGWVDLERIIAEIHDPATDPQDARRFYLNQITHASDSYISQPEWAGCRDTDKPLEPGDYITLGFDGSRGKAKGKPDATALIGCRISDGHIFQVKVWEADDTHWETWEPPLVEIEAAIDECFKVYNVGAFYCDPAKDWRSYVNAWEAKYGSRVPVKVSRDHPFEWWMVGGRSVFIERAVEGFEGAVRNKDMTHDGSLALTSHVLNARRRIRHQKLTVGKESDYSSKKVDACVGAILAWQARMDCVAAGIGTKPKRRAPIRVR
jgi:hypothetical protein